MKLKLPAFFLACFLALTTYCQVSAPAYVATINSTCTPASVTFTNVLQSNSTYTVNHNWTFGNGNTSNSSAPASQNYTSSGAYTIIDTVFVQEPITDTYIKTVTVTAVTCTDPFSAVDLYLVLSNSITAVDVTPYVPNQDPPVIFTYSQTPNGLLLDPASSYSIQVMNDEAITNGWPLPEDCGTVSFNSNSAQTTFSLTNGGLSLIVELVRVSGVRVDTLITTTQFTVGASPTLTATTSNTLICVGETATLSVAGSATSYTWSTTETALSITVSPVSQTTYTVNGTAGNGCENRTTVLQKVDQCTGLDVLKEADNALQIYPNPTNGLVTIELGASAEVEVLNAVAKVILKETMTEGKHTLDLSKESSGIYMIKASQNNRQHTIKVVKQ